MSKRISLKNDYKLLVGSYLKHERISRMVSVTDLANYLKTDEDFIHSIEENNEVVYGEKFIRGICEFLDISEDSICCKLGDLDASMKKRIMMIEHSEEIDENVSISDSEDVVKIDLNKMFKLVNHPVIRISITGYLSMYGEEANIVEMGKEEYYEMRRLFGNVIEDCIVGEIPSKNNEKFYIIDSNKVFKHLVKNSLNPMEVLMSLGFDKDNCVEIVESDTFELFDSDYKKIESLTKLDLSDCVLDEGIYLDSDEVQEKLACTKARRVTNSIIQSEGYKPNPLAEALKDRVRVLKRENDELEKDLTIARSSCEKLERENRELKLLLKRMKSSIDNLYSSVDGLI